VETLTEFTALTEDRPGTLSELAMLLASERINIRTLVAVPAPDQRTIMRFIVDDITKTESTLAQSGLEYSSRSVLAVEISNEPGSLGGLAKYLAGYQINIESLYVLETGPGTITVVLGLDRLDEARDLLA
jgi:hypothetical protein